VTLHVLESLAVGGMAEVSLAREVGHAGFARLVVIKRIRHEHADDLELVTMFFDEARLLARLSHPHIAQVHALGESDGRPFLVMEHVRGATLRELMERGRPLAVRAVAGIGLAIAQALSYAHALTDEHGRTLGVVHRDLTPANVIVADSGVVKLLDFGIAKWVSRAYETATGVVKGTTGYMSPEQNAGGAIDQRSDVFSLGVLLHALAMGRAPTDPWTPDDGALPRTGSPLDGLLDAAVAIDPSARPAMHQLAVHLSSLAPGLTFAELAQLTR
jgi:serine/threonine protein kinase